MNRFFFAAAVLVVGVAALFAACGDDGDDGEGTPTSPAASETASPTTPGPTSTPPASPTATPTETENENISYTVVAGDTLFSIARRFGTTVEAITELNGIEDENDIRVGLVLKIPRAESPGGTPTTTTRTATPEPSGPSVVVRSGSRASNKVALTFDMGGRLDPAVDIMNFLVANNVRATIFPTGSSLDSPNTDLGRRALAIADEHPDLFDVANHSYSHPDFTQISAAEMADELARTEASIATLTSQSPRPLFRPPFGAYNDAVLAGVGAVGYSYTVMWDVDTIDWRPESDGGPTAADIVRKVLDNAQGGSIVLMHLGGFNTLAALPEIVEGLRARGFELATVAEVLAE